MKGLIGLTGNIATGKSEVGKALAALGCAVIDADMIAREIVAPGTPTLARIVETFGSAYLLPSRELNRHKLGNLVFNDKTELAKLEAITHPAARAELWRRVARAYANGARHVVIEVIRLFEGAYDVDCEQVWVTTCTPTTQIERLMHTRNLTQDEANARVNAQAPQSAKIARAHVVIDTNGDLTNTHAQLQRAFAALTKI